MKKIRKLREFNEQRYAGDRLGLPDKERIEKVVSLVGSDKKVLDIGCGSGDLAKQILDNGNQVYGIDISKKALSKATKVGIKTRFCDIENSDLPFEEGFFDVVVGGEIIEHVVDTDHLLRELRRVLKDGGEAVISTPNLAAFGRRFLLLFGRNPLCEVRLGKLDAGHLRYFVKESLYSLLESHHFKIVVFTSDRINFNSSGSLKSTFLARVFPTFGKTLIIKIVKAG